MELVKFFSFSDKKPGFLEIIEVCHNLGIRFCLSWLVLLNYKKISLKTNFKLTMRATLMILEWKNYTRKLNVLLESRQTVLSAGSLKKDKTNKNHNKLMKTLSCTASRSVPMYMMCYNEGWNGIAILIILWNQEATFRRC